MQVELGAGISVDKKVYKELFELDHVRKFTKSLAVAIWGSEVLSRRSVKGKPCRNRNGPKKIAPGSINHAMNRPIESKPPLTPEKLAVISGNNQIFFFFLFK